LQALKAQDPEFVIIPWGITAASQAECGTEGFNATGFAVEAAKYLGTAYVIGANGVGERRYGRFRPSWYCGTSGFATPGGEVGGVADREQSIAVFDIPARAH
jgi:N-carbamoylputrescine amidase